jgi:tetratricopeptide (TPR) repeat protein
MLWLLLACTPAAPPPALECRVLSAPAPGPLSKARSKTTDPLEIAGIFVEEGRLTGDGGYYELAANAVGCAKSQRGETAAVLLAEGRGLLQLHRFGQAEERGRKLRGIEDSADAQLLVADALFEQGKLDEAAAIYDELLRRSRAPALLGRVAWLRQAMGDGDGAVELWEMARRMPMKPEEEAWVLAQLGWQRALRGQPAPELDQALGLLPDYSEALLFRGRLRAFQGDREAAIADLRRAGPRWDARRALAEIEGTDPLPDCRLDRRGCAVYLADRDPQRARKLMEEELSARRDAATLAYAAYVEFRLGKPAKEQMTQALASGNRDPQLLIVAGLVLEDRALVQAALRAGVGLFAEERKRGEAFLGTP